MITVNGAMLNISTIEKRYPSNSIEMQLLDEMSRSTETYLYDNLNQLKFELRYRKEIINSSVKLNDSGLSFSGFADSRCNPKYWHMLHFFHCTGFR